MNLDGAVVRRLRENLGLTAQDLAGAARVSKAHLSMIENNRRGVSPQVASRIAQALGVAIVDLRRDY